MIVDSHIHLYPPEVFSAPKAWAEKRGETYWLSCVAPPKGKSLQAWKTVDELLEDMDAAGVEHAIILAWYWEKHDSCVENQAWQKQWISQHPDRLSALAPFNALGGEAAIDLFKSALDSGFKGLGELNPPAQGYAYSNPILHQALELAGQYDAVANFHVTDPTTHDYPGKITTPYSELLKLANEHSSTQFIFAHLGGCEAFRVKESAPANVYYDTAACPLLYKEPVYRKFCDTISPDKILFGTDYPLRVFPKDKNSPEFSAPLAELTNTTLTSSETKAILGLNARKLFKLS
ncbi:amidohydrolase family protein [Pelagicoccus mobilis]|uniref:Amidohydrolase n=1 Tax=Pelagicoccus mobilis TaxID=415221 RepID=A0A934VRH8_9BACT|nr:amidohydrolase family protein [Pelagicoccus mobilis]MBK1879412.1 amidohydrolase [Pelagicoccus mobilis]